MENHMAPFSFPLSDPVRIGMERILRRCFPAFLREIRQFSFSPHCGFPSGYTVLFEPHCSRNAQCFIIGSSHES